MIVLIGFMGAGKTTVGGMVAERAGLPFVDVDEVIARSEGTSVPEIFTTQGESYFRAVEKAAVEEVLAGPESIVAVGGGALGDPVTCVALEWHTVIHLDVSYAEAMRRVGHDPGRPMLAIDDPRALYEMRHPTYERVARHTIATDGLPATDVAALVLGIAGVQKPSGAAGITVRLGDRSYQVHVGPDLSRDLIGFFDKSQATKAFLITQPGLTESAKPAADSLTEGGLEVVVLTVDDGEHSKDLTVAARLLGTLADHEARRTDVVVSFGGGVVCDLAGFVASIYNRGIPIVHVPTSLLAQVDAAIGGKTAVNLPHGKNLVGTIHQPLAVVCDVSLLRTLPEEEVRAGLAEVIKCALITGKRAVESVFERIPAALALDEDVLAAIVRDAVGTKTAVVAADERELGTREVLNYGHTFGHALEHSTGMRHGDAVAVGMMAAAHLAADLGMLTLEEVELHRRLLEQAGLPVAASFDIDEAFAALRHDKKNRAEIRFVLLSAIGAPQRGVTATTDQIATALRKVSI